MSAERLTGFCPGDDYPTPEELAAVAAAIGAIPVGEWTIERSDGDPHGSAQSGWICSVMAERAEVSA